MIGKRILVAITLLFLGSVAGAAGYSSWAVPTSVEIVSGGIVIFGAFGNENNCSTADAILYPSTQVDYDVVVSMALAAVTAGREMRFYADECVTFAFHGGTINRARNGQAIYFR